PIMSSPLIRNVYLFMMFAVWGSILALSPSAQSQTPVKTEPAEGQTLHVLLGKSVVINVAAPLTRVLSSNPAAIETMATSPTEVVLEGKAPGASSVILWDDTGHSQVLDVQVDLDVAGLRSAIQHAYPGEHLEVEADGGHLVLTGSASNPQIIENL